MSNFTKQENWCYSSGDFYITSRELSWEIGKEGSGLILTVPEHYVFDISVPKYLRWLVSNHDERLLKAAALHDYALDIGWDRVSSASVFHGGLKAQRIHSWKRLALTMAVIVWNWK